MSVLYQLTELVWIRAVLSSVHGTNFFQKRTRNCVRLIRFHSGHLWSTSFDLWIDDCTWTESSIKYKILTRCRIPTYSTVVEKCFNSIVFIIHEYRTSVHPNQINSIIVLRPAGHLKK